MEVSFEILIILNVAIIFTIIAVLSKEDNQKTIFSLITAIAWMTLSLGFVAAQPSFPSYAMLFLAISIIFVVRTIIISADMMREKRTWR